MSQLDYTPAQSGPDIRQRLLDAALREFAQFGLQGARLERIAADANCAKRMIYYYFSDKDGLYVSVLRTAYGDIRQSEADLALDSLDPLSALHLLATHSFDYHARNPDFTRLVLLENLQNASMLQKIGPESAQLRFAALEPLARILHRGAEMGQFKPGLRAEDVHYLISQFSCYRNDHSNTWSKLLQVDLLSPDFESCHKAMMVELLDFYVRA